MSIFLIWNVLHMDFVITIGLILDEGIFRACLMTEMCLEYSKLLKKKISPNSKYLSLMFSKKALNLFNFA